MTRFSPQLGHYVEKKDLQICVMIIPEGTSFSKDKVDKNWDAFKQASLDLRDEVLFTYVEGHEKFADTVSR